MAGLHSTASISVDALPATGWPSIADATAVDYRTAIHPQNLTSALSGAIPIIAIRE